MLDTVHALIVILTILLTAAFAYQGVFMLIGFLRRRDTARYDAPESSVLHPYAALISARNESAVIGELIASLKAQNYPRELLDIYVIADNCTDDTAKQARQAGAHVFERFNTRLLGKGYALDELFSQLQAAGLTEKYAGYFIFDADNLVDPDFVRQMNNTFCSGKYAAITCYRNSKNFGANWISAGYSLWFLREARFLNYPRSILGSNCTVSGTGYLISADVIRENGGWPFHLMTEDLQFSADCTIGGKRIGYCDKAVIYDEQPTSFRQSWDQRVRWTKGFYQVAWRYAPQLIPGIGRGGKHALSCYDILMIVAPGSLLTVTLVLVNGFLLLAGLMQPDAVVSTLLPTQIKLLAVNAALSYLGFAAMGLITVLCEWDSIQATRRQKLGYVLTFPLFMFTYVPIAVAALRRKVEWKHIQHHRCSAAMMGRYTQRPKRKALLDRIA